MPAHRRLDRSKARKGRRDSNHEQSPTPGSRGRPEARGLRDTGPARTARDAAHRALVGAAARYPDLLPLGPEVARLTERLDPRDAALAHAIVDAAVRRWGTLAYLLGLHTRQPFAQLEPGVQAPLLAGAAQLLLLDRVPAHAALNESVAWTKHTISRGASGVVNAVLRRIAGLRGHEDEPLRPAWEDALDALPRPDGGATPLAAPVLPEDPARRLCVATSTPRGLFDARVRAHGAEAARALCLHDLVIPPTILNVEHAPADTLPGNALEPHREPGMAPWTGSIESLAALLRERADVWAQDPTAAAALRDAMEIASRDGSDAAPREPGLAIDLCAGRGTKTRQLLAMHPSARVVAADVDAARLADLERLAERTIADGRLAVMPAEEAVAAHAGRADLVLLDVPCSNSGVLPRRPEARYRLGMSQARRLAEIQTALVAKGVQLLAPGGLLVYSTCSLDAIENEEVVAWARRNHALRLLGERTAMPLGLPGEPAAAYRDGGYVAVLGR